MLDNYFNGVIEQTYHRVGNWEKNMVVARYTNDYSLRSLASVKRYSEEDNVFFACYEFEYGQFSGAYEPFLDIICSVFKECGDGDFDSFMDHCKVYSLHKDILKHYYNGQPCFRQEPVLLGEVKYEQERMTDAVAEMMRAVARLKPIVIIINRFQQASKSTMDVIWQLYLKPSQNIGIVMAANDSPSFKNSNHTVWDNIMESLDDENRVYHMGNSGKSRANRVNAEDEEINLESLYKKANEMAYFFDFEHASQNLEKLEQITLRRREFEEHFLFQVRCLHAYCCVMNEELQTAQEILGNIDGEELSAKDAYQVHYIKTLCYIYQGKLQKAMELIDFCREICGEIEDDFYLFMIDLLEVQAKMSGWYNIFFCVSDVDVNEELIEKLMKHEFYNHLAHIYIYAFDNGPEVVAKAYRTEGALIHFGRGVDLAKKIGNRELVCAAYQKNLMIAAANGMYEIAVLYSIRIYQALDKEKSLDMGRIYSGLGYNLSALGEAELAEAYYKYAITILYGLRLPEDIAEVHYNMALNCIQKKQYEEAEHYLLLCMKAIERLHLNSLRVANLSKLYALLGLVSILLGDRFNSERYLQNCRQFLNYILEKDNTDIGIIHDYARCDDDLFLYNFSRGLVNLQDGNLEATLECYLAAERYLMNSEGNQFFVQNLFREKRMELFKLMGRDMLYEIEKDRLEQNIALGQVKYSDNLMNLLAEVALSSEQAEAEAIPEEWLENLMKQEGLSIELQDNRKQLEFISNWQKQIDITTLNTGMMVEQAMRTFLNHFNNDCALYIRYHKSNCSVLYNNTGVEVSDRMKQIINTMMQEYPNGFAVSKIDSNYYEYTDLISLFGEDTVCSFVAVPFFKEHRLHSVLLTYVKMQDNWHSSLARYMLTEDDLNIYRLLFQEMSYSINRMEAYETVFDMNKKLSQMAVTDLLTGIYNRSGMYQETKRIIAEIMRGNRDNKMGIMFIDLDNFKNYNDTFGHQVGDRMLVAMTKLFSEAVGDKGIACRYGGDEFILILDTTDREELEGLAKKIFDDIHAKNGFKQEVAFSLGVSPDEIQMPEEQKLSCSIGIAVNDDVRSEKDVQELLKAADRTLYEVKEGTKGTYAFT